MPENNTIQLARILDNAAMSARATEQLTAIHPDLSLADAYAIQRQLIACRADRGETVVGLKMGFTSRAKMAQMGVSDQIWGLLTDAMQIAEGGELNLSKFIHPRIEPEVAFRLKSPLSGKIDVADAQVAVDAVAPAMEVIDSRYADFRFALADVVADNSSSSAFVVGDWQEPDSDLSDLGMLMNFDNETVQSGRTSAILGDPLNSLVEAARLASEAGMQLEAGWIILCGAATSAEALRPGIRVTLEAERLGTVQLSVTGEPK